MLGHFAHVDTSGIKTLTVDYSGRHPGHLMEVKVRDKETESVGGRFGLLIPSAKKRKKVRLTLLMPFPSLTKTHTAGTYYKW